MEKTTHQLIEELSEKIERSKAESRSNLRSEIHAAVREVVNGKIDTLRAELQAHNDAHEGDMARMMPIIEEFEANQQRMEDAKSSGKFVLWMASFIIALGGAWIVIERLISSRP